MVKFQHGVPQADLEIMLSIVWRQQSVLRGAGCCMQGGARFPPAAEQRVGVPVMTIMMFLVRYNSGWGGWGGLISSCTTLVAIVLSASVAAALGLRCIENLELPRTTNTPVVFRVISSR